MRYKNKTSKLLSFAAFTLVLASSAYVYFFLVSTKSDFESKAAGCTVSDKLVNSCRPWVGASTGGYNQVALDKATQFAYADKRLNDPEVLTKPGKVVTINKKLDVYHFFHPAGEDVITSTEKAYINRANTYVLINWKPSDVWANAGGGNATVNQRIVTMAQSVKALGSKKIILTVFHEPENDVSKVVGCSGLSLNSAAAAGSPAEYRQMWANVRDIFNKQGVTNVVWGMNYMGYSGWNCLVPLLWPGNDYVDWILYDPYAHGTTSFDASIATFYNFLSANSDAAHNYNSKQWGIAEHGYGNKNGNSTQALATAYWDNARVVVTANKYPKIKLFSAFDSAVNGDSQVGMNFGNTQPTPNEQAAFNTYVAAVQALGVTTTGGGTTGGGTTGGGTTGGGTTGGGTTGGGTTSSNTNSQSSSSNVTQGDLLTLDESTLNDQAVIANIIKVEFFIDGSLYQTVEQEPFGLDTTGLAPGSYDVTQKTYFKDGSITEETKVIEVAGAQTAADSSSKKTNTIIIIVMSLLFGIVIIFLLVWFIVLRPKGYSLGESLGMVGYTLKQLVPRRKPKTPKYTADYDATQEIPPTSHKFPWL